MGVSDGVWDKPAEVLARRLEVGSIVDLLHKGHVYIQEGTNAVLLQGGRFKDVLKAGEHTLASLGQKINHWGDPPPKTIVLVDSGDVVLPLRVTDLRSAEDIDVTMYAEVSIRLIGNDKAGNAFIANIMKQAPELTYSDFAAMLVNELRYAARNMAQTSTVEDLIKDPDRRLRLEDELSRTLKSATERFGFELVRVSSVEFTGIEYEKLLEQQGDLDLKRREIELNQRMRELTQGDRMHSFKTEQDLEEYIDQLTHEQGLSNAARDQEKKKVIIRYRHELEQIETENRRAGEIHELKHDGEKRDIGRSEAIKDTDHNARIGVMQAQGEADASRIKDDEELRSTKKWLEVRAEKERLADETEQRRLNMQAQHKAQMAKILSGCDRDVLVSMIEDAGQRDAVLELTRLELQKGRSSSEILAMAAERSPQAAQALATMAGVEKEEFEKLMKERKELFEDTRKHDEDVLRQATDVAKTAASNPGQTAQNIIRQ